MKQFSSEFGSLDLVVNQRQIRAILDTGANKSIISEKLAREMGLKVKKAGSRTIVVETALVVEELPLKYCFVPIKVQNECFVLKMFVTGNLTNGIIIGRRHCCVMKIDIMFSSGKICINGTLVN